MNALREHPVRQGMGRALLTGLGVVLALLLLLGLYAAQALSSVSRAGTLTARQYFQQSERLERVHRLTSSASVAIRNFLLGSDPQTLPKQRGDALRSWSQAMGAIKDYTEVASPDRRPLIDRLQAEAAAYWAVAERSLELGGSRRSDAAGSLLVSQLAPLREKVLTTFAEISAADRAALRSEAAGTARSAKRAEQRLWAAIAFTVVLSLLVAGTTVRYLMGLERTALAQYQASVQTSAELENLSRRLLTLQEDERQRIARELHDDFGQRMAGLLFELAATAERPDATIDMKAAIQAAGERLGHVAKDLQQLSRSLHSAVLDKIGLEAAIRSDCNSLRQRTGWEIDCQSIGVPKRLPEPVSLAAYRVFQEAVQNAIKHSGTKRLDISLMIEAGALVLRIRDHGHGFDATSADQNGGLGLLSMRERLRMIGGWLTIDSDAGKGTQVEARLPLAQAATL